MDTYICCGIQGVRKGYVGSTRWHLTLSRRVQILHRPQLLVQLNAISSLTVLVMKPVAVLGVFLGYVSVGNAVKLNLLFAATTMCTVARLIIQLVTLLGIYVSRFVLNPCSINLLCFALSNTIFSLNLSICVTCAVLNHQYS